MSQLAKDIERLVLPVATELSFTDPALTTKGSRPAPPPSGPVPNTFYVTFSPHEYLWIEAPVTFEFRVPISYSAMPPTVSCKDEAFTSKFGDKLEVDASGQVMLNILRLGSCAWMRGYTISDVIHCIHHKLQVPDMPQVKVILPVTSPSTRGRRDAPPPPLLSGEFGLQGKRPTMEDQTVCLDRLMVGDGKAMGFYAVYDGHGGAAASKFASERVHQQFVDNLKSGLDVRRALYNAFRTTDSAFEAENKSDDPLGSAELSGTTAAVVIVDGLKVIAGNVGDSRAVLSREGSALALTDDHKANRPDEIARIVNAGGFVVHNRVMGRLAVSRAIGDIAFKTGTNGAQMVTGAPELFETTLCDKDELIIIGCDGLFDVMSSQQVISFARSSMSEGASPTEVAKQLALEALKLGSNDNISVVCVKLGEGVPKGSIRRAPPMLAMMEGSMGAASGGKAGTMAATGAAAGPASARKIYSSNPFSKSFNPGEGSSGGKSRLQASGPSSSVAAPHVESMVSAMRLDDPEPGAGGTGDDNLMKLPPPSYTSYSRPTSSVPDDAGSSPSHFSVPGIPTYSSISSLAVPSFAPTSSSVRPQSGAPKTAELSKQEEEDLMESILHDAT